MESIRAILMKAAKKVQNSLKFGHFPLKAIRGAAISETSIARRGVDGIKGIKVIIITPPGLSS
jgi:hypothetical protein